MLQTTSNALLDVRLNKSAVCFHIFLTIYRDSLYVSTIFHPHNCRFLLVISVWRDMNTNIFRQPTETTSIIFSDVSSFSPKCVRVRKLCYHVPSHHTHSWFREWHDKRIYSIAIKFSLSITTTKKKKKKQRPHNPTSSSTLHTTKWIIYHTKYCTSHSHEINIHETMNQINMPSCLRAWKFVSSYYTHIASAKHETFIGGIMEACNKLYPFEPPDKYTWYYCCAATGKRRGRKLWKLLSTFSRLMWARTTPTCVCVCVLVERKSNISFNTLPAQCHSRRLSRISAEATASETCTLYNATMMNDDG